MPYHTIPAYDLHIHTALSPCAAGRGSLCSVEAYAQEAERRGMELICITDHFALPAPWTPRWYESSGPEIIRRTREAARRVSNGVGILVGCEAEMVSPGKVTVDARFAQELDFILLAASHFHFDEIGPPRSSAPEVVARQLVAYLEAAVALPFVDAVAHPLAVPSSPFGNISACSSLITDDELARICAAAAANNVAFEINGAGAREEDYRIATRRLFLAARSVGVRFTAGSDAHAVGGMAALQAADSFARELGLERDDFLTRAELVTLRQERGCAFS